MNYNQTIMVNHFAKDIEILEVKIEEEFKHKYLRPLLYNRVPKRERGKTSSIFFHVPFL